MQSRELEGHCSLCGRDLVQHVDHAHDLQVYIDQIDAQIEELQELQEQYNEDIERIHIDLQETQNRLAQRRAELDDAIANFVSPVMENVENLSYEIAKVDEELASLTEKQRWLDRIEQMRNSLSDLEERITEVRQRKQELEEQERLMRSRLQPFERFFIHFISDIYPNFQQAQIDDNFLPRINDHSYKAKSATQKNIAILGYYYALLRFSLERSSNTPRFLVIDTLRQDDLERDLYNRTLEKFAELERTYPGQFQMFLVVRDEIPELQSYELLPPFPLINDQKLLDL
jgi:DNA repair exonuclease SbcCD ATPase subunit